MEDCAIIVAVETVLEEVSRGERCLLREELEANVAGCGVEDAGGGGLGFEVIEGRHCDGETCKLTRPENEWWEIEGSFEFEFTGVAR